MNRHTPRIPGTNVGFYPVITAAMLGIVLGDWVSDALGTGRGTWFLLMVGSVTACEVVLVQSLSWTRGYVARRQARRRPGW